jgi:hypothetical protein
MWSDATMNLSKEDLDVLFEYFQILIEIDERLKGEERANKTLPDSTA